MPGGSLDPAQDFGGHLLEASAGAAADVCQKLLQLAAQVFCRWRGRGMLVQDTSARRFERCGNRTDRFGDIRVDEAAEPLGLRAEAGDEGLNQKEQLQLRL